MFSQNFETERYLLHYFVTSVTTQVTLAELPSSIPPPARSSCVSTKT
jgi:hypothetical protein